MGLRRLVDCDIWCSWRDGACCPLANPSSPSRRSSIRPEPLEADISKRRSQVVTLSSSSLATAASAGLFHCNAQLLSYRDWQNYTWLISPWSQGPKICGIIQKPDQWMEAHRKRCQNAPSLAVCEVSVWVFQISSWIFTVAEMPPISHISVLQCTKPTPDIWIETITWWKASMCLIIFMYVCVAPWSQRVNEGQWVQRKRGWGVKVFGGLCN